MRIVYTHYRSCYAIEGIVHAVGTAPQPFVTQISIMPRNRFKCCCEVYDEFKVFHSSCNKARAGELKTGAFLNQFVKSTSPFIPRKRYYICYNLSLALSLRTPYKKKREKKVFPEIPPTTRVARMLKRRQRCDLVSSVEVDQNDNSEGNEVESEKKRRRFTDRINEYAIPFHKPFQKLKLRKRVERIDDIASLIIANCIDKTKVSKNGLGYILGNEEFAHDVLNVFNGIRDRLELKLRVNLNDKEFPNPVELVDDDEDANCSGLSNSMNDKTVQMAYSIIGESTGRGYERVRKKIHELPSNQVELPSLYRLKQQLPLKVIPVNKCLPVNTHKSNLKTELMLGTSNESFKTEEEAMVLLSDMSENTTGSSQLGIRGAKLDSTYVGVIKLMMEKHVAKGINLKDGDDIIILNSFDGAEAFKSQKNVGSIISFSSSMFSPSMIQSQLIKGGSSFNICTWMQIMGNENLNLIQTVLDEQYWNERKSFLNRTLPSSKKSWVYDIHDAKMLYTLLQHSQWNRIHHPFIACKCSRNDGLANENHQCVMIDDCESKRLWDRSLRRWESKTSRSEKYNASQHRAWCDESNCGVTHFGIHPDSLPISTLRYDIFHCRCSVIRSIMNYIRSFMLKQSADIRLLFTNSILCQIWSKFHVYCWNNKLNFSSFKGNELFQFVRNAEVISQFIDDELFTTEETLDIIEALKVIKRIFDFTSITYIEDGVKYDELLVQFKDDVKLLFRHGKDTFLAGNGVTFYFHCLRFYLPQIADITFKRHKLGLGIFTMQGFERRNKESKNTINRFSTLNRKSDKLLVNNMTRLLQVFLYEMNAY